MTYIDAGALNGMKFCADEEDLFDMFGMLGLDKAMAMICPLNDAELDQTARGSHWAFMLITRQSLESDIECFVFDSGRAGSSLGRVAQEAANKIKILMKAKNTGQIQAQSVSNFPQQGNSYDCGVFALLGAEVVI